MRHSRFKGCSKKEDLPSQAQTRPAALCADRGIEGGGTPPHQPRGVTDKAQPCCGHESMLTKKLEVGLSAGHDTPSGTPANGWPLSLI